MTGSDYSDRLYLARPIDQALFDAARKWLGATKHIQWISLRTSPGQGNTWLLKRLEDVTSKATGFDDIQKVVINADDCDVGNGIGPLGLELFRRYRALGLTPLRHFRRRLRQASRGRILLVTTAVLIFLLLGFLLSGLEQFGSTTDVPWTQPGNWWTTFWRDFAPRNWHKFPLWFVTSYLVSIVPVAIALLWAYLYRSNKKRVQQLNLEEPKDDELDYFKSVEGMIDELFQICRKSRGIMLLIDDSHELPKAEKQLLIDLSKENSPTNVQDFRQRYRILIVTVESQQATEKNFPPASEKMLVRPFDLVELRDIALGQLNRDEDKAVRETINKLADQSTSQDPELSEPANLLEQAQHNIKVLFAHRERNLIDQMGNEFETHKGDGIKGIVGVAELMAYIAFLHERTVGKSELFEQLKSAESSHHLGFFGLKLPNDVEGLVNKFVASSLVKFTAKATDDPEEQTCYLDLVRCQAMRRWLREQPDRRPLVVQAHYHWFSMKSHSVIPLDVEPEHIYEISRLQPDVIKRAAWHLAQIGKFVDEVSSVLIQAPSLTDQESVQRRSHVVAALISAAIVNRGEGDLVEANDLLLDAAEWLAKSTNPEHRKWLECVGDLLWHNFWLRNTPTARDQLTALAAAYSDLVEAPFWRVHQRFEEILQGKEELSDAPDQALLANADQANLHQLTEVLKEIRDTNGLIVPAVRDDAVSIREPQETQICALAESHLRQLQVAAMNERGLESEVKDALNQWRLRLKATEPSRSNLGSEVLHNYDKARYWHLLADVSQQATEPLDTFTEDLNGDGQAQIDGEFWQQARNAYERVLQIAALLDWRPLVMEVSFHLGVLLRQYTPEEQRRDSAPWWEPWDELFKRSIDLERELGWVIHTPAMHQIRWKFFEDIDRERSLDDAYNAFQSAKRANFPIEILLKWHQQVSTSLTNYSDSDVDRQRDAELHEEWANELASLDAATGYWHFKHLELEHEHALELECAYALLFAAQARRLLNQTDRAEKLLDQADELMKQGIVTVTEEELDDRELHRLRTGLKMQRAWVYEAQNRKEEYRQAIHDTWLTMRPDDGDCSNLLSSRVYIEHEDKILSQSWPPTPELAPNYDPDNDAWSLPAAWFQGDVAFELKNRFEFRLCQFLNLTNMAKSVAADGGLSESSNLHGFMGVLRLHLMRSTSPNVFEMSHPKIQFSIERLKIAAQLNWMGMNRYGEIALSFASLGLHYRLSDETRSLIINLLLAVRSYFAEVNPVDTDELQALRLLMNYNVDYRDEYVRVLSNSQYMLAHELRAQSAGGPAWFGIAKRINDYLGVLVDTALLSNAVMGGMQLSGLTPDKFHKRLEDLRKTVNEAQTLFEGGSPELCFQKLEAVLPAKAGQWVFLEELQILDLWLRCARSSTTPKSVELENQLNQRATQLRQSALKYIGQFRLIIREQQVQKLTMELLRSIEQST